MKTPLIQLLENYEPKTETCAINKLKILSFIDTSERCFERTLAVGHITASSWLVNPENSCALLMHHKKLNRWLQPGGHCDGNPDVLQVSIQEAQEESGILGIAPLSFEIFDLDVHKIPESKTISAHYHYDIRFLLQVKTKEIAKKNHESNELRWITKDPNSLPTNDPSILRLFQKWIDWGKKTT